MRNSDEAKRVGVGGWGGPTSSDRAVYGWLPLDEFLEAFPEKREALESLNQQAEREHRNPILVMSDGVFVVPPACIRKTQGLERVDLVRLLLEEDDIRQAEQDMTDGLIG